MLEASDAGMGTAETGSSIKTTKPPVSQEAPPQVPGPEWGFQTTYYPGNTAPAYFWPQPMPPYPYPPYYQQFGGQQPYGMASPSSGNEAPVTDGDGKSPESKEKKTSKKAKGNGGKVKGNEIVKAGENGAVSQSGASDSEASSDGSEGEKGQEGSEKKRQTTEGKGASMGMDYCWGGGVSGSKSKRASMVPGPQETWIPDERELKRQRRKQSNRESARRSRLRKQKECEDLASKVDELASENTNLRNELQRIQDELKQMSSDNSSLRDQLLKKPSEDENFKLTTGSLPNQSVTGLFALSPKRIMSSSSVYQGGRPPGGSSSSSSSYRAPAPQPPQSNPQVQHKQQQQPYGNQYSYQQQQQQQQPPPGVIPPRPPPPYGSSAPAPSSAHQQYPQHSSSYYRPPSTYGTFPSSSSQQPSVAPSNRAPSSAWQQPTQNHRPQQSGHRETEDERRERKKREYEMRKQRGPSSANQSASKHRLDKKNSSLPDKTENRLKRPSTFLCKIKFRNELPDPVSQPKLLQIYSDKDRYSKYSLTSLEKTYKHKLFVEPDLGIPLDLLDLSVYNAPKSRPAMDPADAELLADDEVVVKQKTDSIRRKERPTDKGMAWLVKTTYISPVNMDPAKQSLTEKQAKELREQKEGRRVETLNDREQQIQAIEESFRVSKVQPVHQTKPDLEPLEILPLLPDFDRSGDTFVHMIFDTEPTTESELHSKLDREMRDELESRAIVKSYSVPSRDESRHERFLAYMVPKAEEAFNEDTDDGIAYTWVREYHSDVRSEDARNNYIFCFGEDAVRYLPLNSKILCHKKKAKEGRSKDDVDNQFLVPATVTVRRRLLTDDEESHRENSRHTFMEGQRDEAGQSSRKRSRETRKVSSSKHRRGYEEENNRGISEEEDVSM